MICTWYAPRCQTHRSSGAVCGMFHRHTVKHCLLPEDSDEEETPARKKLKWWGGANPVVSWLMRVVSWFISVYQIRITLYQLDLRWWAEERIAVRITLISQRYHLVSDMFQMCVLGCRAVSHRHITTYHIISCDIMTYHDIWTAAYQRTNITSYHVISWRIMTSELWYFINPYHIISHYITSYHNISETPYQTRITKSYHKPGITNSVIWPTLWYGIRERRTWYGAKNATCNIMKYQADLEHITN